MPKDLKINYIELPGDNFEALETFYSSVFGWKFTSYGAEYRAFTDDTVDGGFFKSTKRSNTDNGAALIIMYAQNLQSIRDAVIQRGGTIGKDIFSFPGGRRFHFQDPHGNELAVWSEN